MPGSVYHTGNVQQIRPAKPLALRSIQSREGSRWEHKETRASLKQVHTVVSVKGREAASEMEPNREGWMLRERL